MDAARSRGTPRGRGRGSSRGGRGKATRARGSQTRGMRVPPEYLQRVIAERQGLDPNSLPDEEEQEEREQGEAEEAARRQSRYRPRELGSNADRYELEGGELGAEDEEEAKETARILEKMRLRDLPTSHSQQPPGGGLSTPSIKTASRNGKSRPPGDSDSDDGDVDHALGVSLKALTGNAGSKRTHKGERGKGQVITIEWDERMEAMSKEKAETEARAALKARFRGQAPAQGVKSNNVAPLGGTPGFRSSGTAGDADVGNSEDPVKKLDELEGFLDDLLG